MTNSVFTERTQTMSDEATKATSEQQWEEMTECMTVEDLKKEISLYVNFIKKSGFKLAFDENFKNTGEFEKLLIKSPIKSLGMAVLVLAIAEREHQLIASRIISIDFGSVMDNEFSPQPYALISRESLGLTTVWPLELDDILKEGVGEHYLLGYDISGFSKL